MNLAALDGHIQDNSAYEARLDAGDAANAAYAAVSDWVDDARSAAMEVREQVFAMQEAAGLDPDVEKLDRAIALLDEIKLGNWRE